MKASVRMSSVILILVIGQWLLVQPSLLAAEEFFSKSENKPIPGVRPWPSSRSDPRGPVRLRAVRTASAPPIAFAAQTSGLPVSHLTKILGAAKDQLDL